MATLTIRVRLDHRRASMSRPEFVVDAIAQSMAGATLEPTPTTVPIIDNRGQTVGNWSVTK